MCIIAAKPAGVQAPDDATLRRMWDANEDGAGFMYNMNGKVNIQKGFMKYTDFIKAWERLGKSVDLTKTAIVLHFRITTHGGTKPENCHPFPITDNIGALKKLHMSCDIGVAHNGIIHNTPREGISDTMEYIATQLAPLKQALPHFYESKPAMLLVKNAIESKMAFLTGKGSIYTVGDFIEDKGILYSNSSYKYDWRNFSWTRWDDYGHTDLWDETFGTTTKSSKKKKSKSSGKTYQLAKPLMWLDEGDYVTFEGDSELWEAYDYLIDEDNRVYEYEYETDMAILLPGATAYNAAGLPAHFDEDAAILTYVDE